MTARLSYNFFKNNIPALGNIIFSAVAASPFIFAQLP
jgi:hypothetical protein